MEKPSRKGAGRGGVRAMPTRTGGPWVRGLCAGEVHLLITWLT